MSHDPGFNIVELVPCPMVSVPGAHPDIPGPPLREVAYRGDAWLPGELDRLRAGFADDEDLQGIADDLDRTLSAVRTKVGELGLRRDSSRPWTAMEDEHLARHYGTVATSTVASDLGRTCAAVYARAGVLALTEGNPPPYTRWEVAQVRAGYDWGVPVARLAVIVGRPASGIASFASKLGIRHRNGPVGWTGEEQGRALAWAETGIRYGEVAERLEQEGFTRREGDAVGQVLRKLGYGRGWGRPWLPEEKDLLRHSYAHDLSLTPLRDRLGRSRSSIAWQAGELGLQGTHARPSGWRTEPSWTAQDIRILKRDYGRVPTKELARWLNRKKGGVYTKAWALGLEHGWMRAFTADEERAIRLARDHGVSLTDLSRALDRDVAVVSKHAIRMGIPFATRAVKAPRGPRRNRPLITLASLLALAP